jgi:glycine/D-amino acid oxidase-like deaminating enzyme
MTVLSRQSDGDARVGVVGPFSGPRAAWGRLLRDAIEAVPFAPIQWEFFDDEGDSGLALARAEEIAEGGDFRAVVGHFNSAGARAALPHYRAAGIPAVFPLSTAPGLLDDAQGWALRICPDDAGQAAAIAQAVLRQGLTRVVVMHDGTAYGRGLATLFQAAAQPALDIVLAPADAAPQPDSPPRADSTPHAGTHADVALTAGPGASPDAQRADAPGDVLGADARADDAPAGDVALPAGGAGLALVVVGQHHRVAAILNRHRNWAGPVFVPDDCDVEEFRELVARPAEVRVARIAGGAPARVAAAVTALALAIEKHPTERGKELLATIAGEVAETPGWTVEHLATQSVHIGRSPKPADVAVVGAGIVGTIAAALLGEAGLSVVLLDGSDHTGASVVSGALVRAFEPDEAMRRLALESFTDFWAAPGPGGVGFRATGGLVLFGEQHRLTAAQGVAQLCAAGVKAELLEPAELARRWPGIRAELASEGIAGAVWEPDAGYVTAPVAMAAMLDRARRAGVELRPHWTVEAIDDGPAGSVILAGGPRARAAEPVAARAALVTSGASAPRLLGDRWPHGVAARTRLIRYALFDRGSLCLPAYVDLHGGSWGRPDGRAGFLAGSPTEIWDVPAATGSGLTGEQIDAIRRGAGVIVPSLRDAAVLAGRFGTDLYSPDGPVLCWVPGKSRIFLASCWSGGGFKTAPAAARVCAQSVRDLIR